MGTAAYMSPEQARGKPVDKRADIWAFGCVLYEMLTGILPFTGGTVSEVLAEVLKSDPDWEALPDETPATVGQVVRRCLQKDPRQPAALPLRPPAATSSLKNTYGGDISGTAGRRMAAEAVPL